MTSGKRPPKYAPRHSESELFNKMFSAIRDLLSVERTHGRESLS
jgi:hypothetical protein